MLSFTLSTSRPYRDGRGYWNTITPIFSHWPLVSAPVKTAHSTWTLDFNSSECHWGLKASIISICTWTVIFHISVPLSQEHYFLRPLYPPFPGPGPALAPALAPSPSPNSISKQNKNPNVPRFFYPGRSILNTGGENPYKFKCLHLNSSPQPNPASKRLRLKLHHCYQSRASSEPFNTQPAYGCFLTITLLPGGSSLSPSHLHNPLL